MSFAGTVLDMINRIKYNESLKQSRNFRFEQVKGAYLKVKLKNDKLDLNKNKISDAELRKLKQKIRREIIKERRRSYIMATAITLVVVGIIILITVYLRKNEIHSLVF